MSNSNKGSRPESERHDLNHLYDKIRTNDSLEPPHNTKDTHKNSPFSSTSSLGHPSEGYANSEDSWSLVSQDEDEINFNDIVSTDGSAEGDYYEGNQNEGEGNQDGTFPTANNFHLQDGSKFLDETFANLDEQLDKTEADIKEQMQVSINSRIIFQRLLHQLQQLFNKLPYMKVLRIFQMFAKCPKPPELRILKREL
ncbi:unnamed protein product [Ambrosiozyma monospora]|uniref:Unnamed protein product n=1 Tax=Ambrosiozyma monospora TaxID=43982 RepID=A0ACB5UCW0_AMBMO|nr:unnamed protein product [Ambrosiozyma monospora]